MLIREKVHSVVHKGIRFAIEQAADGSGWTWEYKIEIQTKTGRISLRTRDAAVRKIRQIIDRDLRHRYLQKRSPDYQERKLVSMKGAAK